MPSPSVLRGHLVDAAIEESPTDIPNGCLLLEGRIITDLGPPDEIRSRHPGIAVPELPEGYPVILPGLVDIHVHLPQYPAVARSEKELLPWLKRHIFPLESRFQATDEKTAEAITLFFDEALANGTTTLVLYGAIWEDSCELAFQIAERRGLRVVLGKVMMDDSSYGSLPADKALRLSLQQTERLAEKWHGANDGLLGYAVSPRFAVACSRGMMVAAARIARKYNCFIQTHLSENHAEIAIVKKRFPWARDYTDVYDQCGLLTPKTILGHCLHLAEQEISTLAENGCTIAHCPTSNLFLNSGLLPKEQFDRAGIRSCLASDVAGGPELNMWQVLRSAIEIQKVRRLQNSDVPELGPLEAFRMATSLAAAALDQDTGRLAVGAEADLLVTDLDAVLPCSGRCTEKPDLSAEEILTLLVYRGHSTAHREVWIAGKGTRVDAGPRSLSC